MNADLRDQMQKYYRYLITSDYFNQLTSQWQTFNVALDDVKAKVGQFTSRKFFLNGAIDVRASGTFEARRADNGHVYMKNINMQWQWIDRIDANSLAESVGRGNFKSMQNWEVVLEGLWDLGPEEIGSVDCGVVIKWKSFKGDDDPNGFLIWQGKNDR